MIARLLATLLAASIIVFLLLNLLPGDPASVILGVDAQPETLAALRRQMGLDQGLFARYLHWMGQLVRLQPGISFTYNIPVAQLLAGRLLVTLPLVVITLALAAALGVPAGVAAAWRQGRPSGTAAIIGLQVAKSIPDFWLGVVFILLFAVWRPWFPAGGFPGWQAGWLAALRALSLPALALALPAAAILARLVRSAAITALQQDYVRTARAKGLSRAAALWRHAVPNALIPAVTMLGVQFPLLLSGTIVVENVFSLPGLGRLLFDAINQRDLIVVQDLVLLLAAITIVVNAAVERISVWLDPRLAPA